MKKLNTVISSRINRSLVLTQVFRNPDISRAQLAEKTGLDPSAITHISKELISRGLIVESAKGRSSSRGGRCPVFLRLREDAHCLLAIEVGLMVARARLCTWEGQTIGSVEIALRRGVDLLATINSVIESVKEAHPGFLDRCVLFAIGTSGVVDVPNGRLVLNVYHKWSNVEVAAPLLEKYGIPVFMENDANAAALGEIARRRSEVHRSLIYFFLRTTLDSETSAMGVGGALIVNGELWHGANGYAGEAGYTLNRRIDKRRKGKSEPLLTLLKRASEGDAAAKREARRIAHEIAAYLSELAVFIDPDAVMVQLVPNHPGDFFIDWIRTEFFDVYTKARRIAFEVGTDEESPPLRGLVALGLSKLFVRSASETSILFRPTEPSLNHTSA